MARPGAAVYRVEYHQGIPADHQGIPADSAPPEDPRQLFSTRRSRLKFATQGSRRLIATPSPPTVGAAWPAAAPQTGPRCKSGLVSCQSDVPAEPAGLLLARRARAEDCAVCSDATVTMMSM